MWLKRIYQEGAICDISARCDSYIDRMVWDGDQLLWELRQENTESSLTGDAQKPSGNKYRGTLSYIHAGGIDAPVGLVKNGSPVVLHRNWRGLFAFSTDTNGDPTTCTPSGGGGCNDFPWPARAPWSYWYEPDVNDTHLWYGTLPLDQADETGLSYRRNRYYDGLSGQFTQEDPIGIAGGLNLYGYAGGDPINFSDPFGLSPCDELWNKGNDMAWAECKKTEYAEEDAARAREEAAQEEFSIGRCALSAGAFSAVLVSDIVTVGAGAASLRAGLRFGGATLSHALDMALGGSSRALGQQASDAGQALVGSVAGTGRSYASGIPVAGAADQVGGQGFSLGMLVPFNGTGSRRDAVARDCG